MTGERQVKLKEVISNLELEGVTPAPPPTRVVTGAYVSDLLSDVMGFSHAGEVWITVQGHMNVVAVAALKELSAVIVCSGRAVEPTVIAKAVEESVVLLCTDKSAYEVCGKLWDLGVRRAG